MKRKYVFLIIVFSVLLLLPFTVQSVADIRGESRFVSLDIFKDIFYTPFKRESLLNQGAVKLDSTWRAAREAIAGGSETSEALEPVIAALSDLEAEALTVNAYAQLDSGESLFKLLKSADTLLVGLEDEPSSFPQVDSSLKSVVYSLKDFSFVRVLDCIGKYGAWKGAYLRAFEKKVEDENALVLALRPKYQLAVWTLFNDPGEKVVLGASMKNAQQEKERWLYYRQDVEFLVQPSPLDVRSAKLDNPIQAMTRFRDQLKRRGVELLVVVVPGKPSIYPEYLTGYVEKMEKHHGQKILDSLAALGFNTVDLYAPLWKAKEGDSLSGPLYLRDDTHWTPRGAELAAAEIARKVQQMQAAGLDLGNQTVAYALKDSSAQRVGDIGEMSGLNKFDVFRPQQVTGHVVYQDDSTGAPFKDDFRKSKILILGDSFSRIYQTDAPVNAGWIAHFAKNMNLPVASIVSDGGASTLVREKLARRSNVLKGKKLLIWEFVERDLRFGAEGWKDVSIGD